jgi:phenylacetate-coenzyme A ligase PaaK-like adenylate-forming protein
VFQYNDIFSISSDKQFHKIALKVFRYQYENNSIYRQFCNYLHIQKEQVKTLEQIPFLPIAFFKSHEIVSCSNTVQEIFTSSGTTGMQTSKHLVTDINWYTESYYRAFAQFYGDIENYAVLALLPSYLDRKGSSLIYMVNDFIEKSNHHDSGFYLRNHDELLQKLEKLK